VLLAWVALCIFIVVALLLDLRTGIRQTKEPSMRPSIAWSIAWTAIGIAFALIVLGIDSGQAASEYLAGFLIEKSLSLDNLFVFAVIFTFFAVPDDQRQRVLVYGIAGAIVLRTAFILAGTAALETFGWATYALGGLLAYTAWRVARHGGEEIDPGETRIMGLLQRTLPLSGDYDGDRLVTRRDGRLLATPLLAALLMVAAFDVMFALDSIPAILAITTDTYIVFAANAFSLLGMVSLYFVLERLLKRFRYLHQGLAAILAYVAAKLLLDDVWHPPIGLSLGVIVGCLAVAALASARAERRDRRRELLSRSGAAPASAPPRS
jgi:TerC family integral membrane protein